VTVRSLLGKRATSGSSNTCVAYALQVARVVSELSLGSAAEAAVANVPALSPQARRPNLLAGVQRSSSKMRHVVHAADDSGDFEARPFVRVIAAVW